MLTSDPEGGGVNFPNTNVNAYFRPGKDHPRRRIWEIIHKSLGRLVFLLGICNCVVGAFVYKTKYGMGPILFYVSLILLFSAVLLDMFFGCYGQILLLFSSLVFSDVVTGY